MGRLGSASFRTPALTDGDQGPPAQTVYQDGSAQCGGAWICEHRWDAIANMVAFRAATDGQGVNNWWDNGNNQIAFSRGNRGFVAINRESGELSRTFTTGLADARKLDPTAYPSWTGSVDLPANTAVEWKCLKRDEQDPNAQVEWQSGGNNQVQTGAAGSTSGSAGAF